MTCSAMTSLGKGRYMSRANHIDIGFSRLPDPVILRHSQCPSEKFDRSSTSAYVVISDRDNVEVDSNDLKHRYP